MNTEIKLSEIICAVKFKEIVANKKPSEVCIKFQNICYTDIEIAKVYEELDLGALDYLINLYNAICEKIPINCANFDFDMFSFDLIKQYVELNTKIELLGKDIIIINDCNCDLKLNKSEYSLNVFEFVKSKIKDLDMTHPILKQLTLAPHFLDIITDTNFFKDTLPI